MELIEQTLGKDATTRTWETIRKCTDAYERIHQQAAAADADQRHAACKCPCRAADRQRRSFIVSKNMKSKSKPAAPPKLIDEYLATLSSDKQAALEKLRRAIRAAVPKAEECISYGVPGFRLNGKYLVGLGATSKHCAFYLGTTVQTNAELLKGYDISKGTIRFPPGNPLPVRLVRSLMKARVAEKKQNKSTA
jgi:uncharacterized protein YdhG (YjbR/CyaY superfamily)